MNAMLDMFLDFYGLEVYERLDGRLYVCTKKSHAVVYINDRYGNTSYGYNHLGYPDIKTLESMLFKSRMMGKVDTAPEKAVWLAVENIFYGCTSLEEMLVRKDLAGAEEVQWREE